MENIIETPENIKTKKEKDLLFVDKDINDILNNPLNALFKEKLITSIKEIKKYQPFLSIEKVEKEIFDMKVDTNVVLESEGDLEIYTEIMENLRAYKDRLFYLFCKAEKEFNILNDRYIHLHTMWTGKFSGLSSEKRREGEAEYILDFLFNEREKRKIIYNLTKNASENMSDKMAIVSRKVAVIQEVHKVIGSFTIDNPLKTLEALKNHRQSVTEKLEEFRKNKKSKANGWDGVPSKEDLS